MYPNLYYLVADLFGIHIEALRVVQSFGFFVAMGFLTASYLFVLELKRKEKEGLVKPSTIKILVGEKATTFELISSAILGFIIGYKLLYIAGNWTEFTANTQKFILSPKGSFIGGVLGGALSAYLKYREKEKEKLPQPIWQEKIMHPYEHVGNMTLIAAVAGIIGAKIFHNLENIDEFLADPWGSLISFSGLTMYGGLIVGATAVIIYARKNNLPVAHVIDASAAGLMLSYGIGRIGCQIAGDGDWGIDNLAPKPSWMSFLPDWMWSYHYPHNVNSVGVPIPGCIETNYCNMLANPVFPTPFYETIMCTLLFFVLWSIRKKITTPGVLFSIYLVFNGVERFLIEQIRINTVYHLFGNAITQAQIISTLLFLLGVTGVFYFRNQEKKKLV